MSKDNPLVAVTLWFKDGAALRQVFAPPIPQSKAMIALGQVVAQLGGELNIHLESVYQEASLRPLPGTRVRQNSIRGRILVFLYERGRPMTIPQLGQYIEYPHKTISTKASELRQLGLTERREDGYWQLTTDFMLQLQKEKGLQWITKMVKRG